MNKQILIPSTDGPATLKHMPAGRYLMRIVRNDNGSEKTVVSGVSQTRIEKTVAKTGTTRCLIQAQIPVSVTDSAKECCCQDEVTYTNDVVTVHTVITLPAKLMRDMASNDANIADTALDGALRAIIVGLQVVSSTIGGYDEGENGFAMMLLDGAGVPIQLAWTPEGDGVGTPLVLKTADWNGSEEGDEVLEGVKSALRAWLLNLG